MGEIGQAHCQAMEGIAEVKLVAVAEPNAERRAIAEDMGAVGYSGYETLLECDDVDAVIIATPDHLHAGPCIAAAKAGKHILVEKPIATTVQEAEAIIDAAQEAHVKLMVGHTLRFFAEYQYAKTSVMDGDVGQLVSLFARRTNIISQQQRLQGRCGVLFFLGVHDFDALRWVGGAEPKRIYCESSTSVPSEFPVENETFTTVYFDNGLVACAHIGWYLPESHPAGFDFKLDVTGSKGVVNLDFTRHVITKYTTEVGVHPLITRALADEIRGFSQCVLDDLVSPISGGDGLVALKMALAAQLSIREVRPVDISEIR